jgi:hypothetical protein
MDDQSAVAEVQQDTRGIFRYLKPSVVSSLYRNGKVFTRRDIDGSDSGWQGVDLEDREMTVHNARALQGADRCTVVANGFELRQRPVEQGGIDFLDHDQVVRKYYAQCAAIVEEATGAHAFAFDHNVRSASGKKTQKRIAGGQQVQGPAHVVHGDYTLTSAPQRLRDLTKPPTANDTLRAVLGEGRSLIDPQMAQHAIGEGGRFAIINVWRNIAAEPVTTHPLALCDAHTVEPEDLVVFEIHYQDRIGENYFARHSPNHRWYYYPLITGEEALLIKQWDSHGKLARSKGEGGDASDKTSPCTFSFHSAFDDPATPPDAPDRWSIEVRCMVCYD